MVALLLARDDDVAGARRLPAGNCKIRWARLEIALGGAGCVTSWTPPPLASLTAMSNACNSSSCRAGDMKSADIHTSGAGVTMLEKVSIAALAGGLAGGFTNVALHPIDTVKTKLQTRGASSLYSGPLDVISKVISKQGIMGLYSGVQAAFVGSVMSSAVYFGTYELAKCIFIHIINIPKAIRPPLAAALGNIASSAVLVPKEVIKQRMQAGAIGSATHVFLETIKIEGISGLYCGYSAALLRNIPSNVISFSTFEYLKLAWLRRNKNEVLSPWQSVLSGAIAGALSAAMTTPLDVVKTRLMTQARTVVASTGMTGVKAEATARAQAIAAYTYTGVLSTMKQMCKEEGATSLLKGISPRIFYSASFSAIGFFVFETVRTYFLLKYMEEKNRDVVISNN